MKFLLAILCLSVSLTAAAQSLRIPHGTFQFSEVQPTVVKHYEMVRSSDKERVQTLQAQRYTCVLKSGEFYQCSKFDKNLELPQSLRQKVLNEVSNRAVIFDELLTPPHLENDGEVLQEYSVAQKITVGDKSYKNYLYQIAQGVHKITPMIDGKNESFNFVVDSTELLREPRSYEVHDSMTRWTLYFVLISLKKSGE